MVVINKAVCEMESSWFRVLVIDLKCVGHLQYCQLMYVTLG